MPPAALWHSHLSRDPGGTKAAMGSVSPAVPVRTSGPLRNPLASVCLSRAICCPSAPCGPYQWSPQGTRKAHKASISDLPVPRGMGSQGKQEGPCVGWSEGHGLLPCLAGIFQRLEGKRKQTLLFAVQTNTLPRHKTSPAAAQRWVGRPDVIRRGFQACP